MDACLQKSFQQRKEKNTESNLALKFYQENKPSRRTSLRELCQNFIQRQRQQTGKLMKRTESPNLEARTAAHLTQLYQGTLQFFTLRKSAK